METQVLYVIVKNNGSEGYQPPAFAFPSKQEAEAFIQALENYHVGCVEIVEVPIVRFHEAKFA